MNTNITEWQPYVYKLSLLKDEKVLYYISSRSHGSAVRYRCGVEVPYACSIHLTERAVKGTSKAVDKLLTEGWEVSDIEIIETFDGTSEGANECARYEYKLLCDLHVRSNDQYVNDSTAGLGGWDDIMYEYKIPKTNTHSMHYKKVIK